MRLELPAARPASPARPCRVSPARSERVAGEGSAVNPRAHGEEEHAPGRLHDRTTDLVSVNLIERLLAG